MEGFAISTDKRYLDEDLIYEFLHHRSYWARGISRELVRRSIANSALCFGVYEGDPAGRRQVGFARIVSDLATFAYLADVFVLERYRGRGLGRWLTQAIVEHRDLLGLRRFILATRDAHALYARFGFAPLAHPERIMERRAEGDARPDLPG